MTVIVVGKDCEHVKHTSCRNCSARLEYVGADTFKHTITDYTGRCDTYTYIKCPSCGEDVMVGVQ
jgi:RNase P subunit RPR2